ncbi:hypothetical protein BKA61DRAFT_574964 [Leptodontidium sp. MPI-SDFR-AT-0119]|nr:hypothetical protein BKA61DRAFT_574964 [Leptodontidium sp. MPI-SDFR-AT-0119]
MLLEVIVDGKQHLHETLLTNVLYGLHNNLISNAAGGPPNQVEFVEQQNPQFGPNFFTPNFTPEAWLAGQIREPHTCRRNTNNSMEESLAKISAPKREMQLDDLQVPRLPAYLDKQRRKTFHSTTPLGQDTPTTTTTTYFHLNLALDLPPHPLLLCRDAKFLIGSMLHLSAPPLLVQKVAPARLCAGERGAKAKKKPMIQAGIRPSCTPKRKGWDTKKMMCIAAFAEHQLKVGPVFCFLLCSFPSPLFVTSRRASIERVVVARQRSSPSQRYLQLRPSRVTQQTVPDTFGASNQIRSST